MTSAKALPRGTVLIARICECSKNRTWDGTLFYPTATSNHPPCKSGRVGGGNCGCLLSVSVLPLNMLLKILFCRCFEANQADDLMFVLLTDLTHKVMNNESQALYPASAHFKIWEISLPVQKKNNVVQLCWKSPNLDDSTRLGTRNNTVGVGGYKKVQVLCFVQNIVIYCKFCKIKIVTTGLLKTSAFYKLY